MNEQKDKPSALIRPLGGVMVWIGYVILGHAQLLDRHDMFIADHPLWLALMIETGLLYGTALVLMLVLRLPRLTVRSALLVLLWVALVVVGHYLAFVEQMNAGEILAAMHMSQGWKSLVLVSLIYALLIGIPFVPGLELGLAIIMLFSWEGSVAVYLSTVAGLSLAFLVGRLLPVGKTGGLEERRERMLGRLGPVLIRYRYLALAVLLNLPGNSVLGGGGGIALACGVSRHYSWPWFLVTVLIATAPVPVMLWFGVISLDQLFA